MILGVGNDVIDIRRIENALARHGARFERRVYTESEIALAGCRPARRAATLALRFAAKEAAAKALGTGFRGGISLRDIEVKTAANGKPELALHGAALARLQALAPPGARSVMHLSLSDEYPHAWAVVVIEAAA